MMGRATGSELRQADQKAQLAQDIADQVEQAGRGLLKVFEKAKSNTIEGFDELDIIIACQQYLTDASRLLIEQLKLEQVKIAETTLLVPKSRG